MSKRPNRRTRGGVPPSLELLARVHAARAARLDMHLTRPEVASLARCHESTWTRWVSEGKAPKPWRAPGTRGIVWRLSDVDAWLAGHERVSSLDEAAAA